eukprot:TRINITY_DN18364_c0_g1_i1.p1 TRINITY_DN18364_c0_g1~~TRINITY_DN18364_c0_g1_i1.p1  ORF type:complete len:913 (+),score=317.69 TRINITY_DN18364_c0_g1_i1:107-2845(+)
MMAGMQGEDECAADPLPLEEDPGEGFADSIAAEEDPSAAAPAPLPPLAVRVVPVSFCLQHLEHKVGRSRLVRDGIVYVPFLVMFVIFATAGRNVTEDYYIDRVLRDLALGNELQNAGSRRDGAPPREVQKGFEDVASVGDYFDWMETVLVPNLFDCGATSGVRFLTQQGLNYLVGGLRFRTLRANRRSCSPDTRIFLKAQSNETSFGGVSLGSSEEKVPELCPVIPSGDLWEPPVFKGIGQTVDCYFVTGDQVPVTYRKEDPSDSSVNPQVAVLQRDERINVVETHYSPSGSDLRDVRIAGPVAGWVHRYDAAGREQISSKRECTVDCINCLGVFDTDNEERAMRFNVSNPLIRSRTLRERDDNRLYRHYTCDQLQDLNRGGTFIIGDIGYYHCGGYVVDVPFNESCSAVQNLVDVIRGVKWLPGGAEEPAAPFVDDIQSRFASVEYFTYTAALDTWSSVKIFVEISPAGAVLPNWEFRHFKVWTEERNLAITIYDFFFFAFVVYYLAKFVYDWKQCQMRTQKLFAFLMDAEQEAVWNLLDFANLAVLVVVFALRMVWWKNSVEHHDGLRFPIEYSYPPRLDRLKDLFMSQVYANSVNNVLSFLKLLKYARLNDKLGVLTMTMSKAKDKIVGILAIFCWVVFAFSMCGQTLYGSAIWGFRNLNSTFMSLMLALLGTFPNVAKGVDGTYDDMRRENRVLTFLYYWGYFILANVLLLNFIIGILAEAFSEANSEVQDVPFHEMVANTVKTVKQTLNPVSLLAAAKLTARGTSRTALLGTTIQSMRIHQNFIEREYQGQDVDLETIAEGQVHRDKLKVFIGEEEYELLGEKYVFDLWDEIEAEYQQYIDRNPEQQQENEMRELLQAGIESAIEPRIQEICAMDYLMQELEFSVDEVCRDVLTLKAMRAQRIAPPG